MLASSWNCCCQELRPVLKPWCLLHTCSTTCRFVNGHQQFSTTHLIHNPTRVSLLEQGWRMLLLLSGHRAHTSAGNAEQKSSLK